MLVKKNLVISICKKFLVLFLLAVLIILSTRNSTNAFYELGDSSLCVDVTLADEFNTLYSVRTTELEVSDGSQFTQYYDDFDFDDVYGGEYDLDTLYSQGYTTMVVEITMDIKEVNDGYQHIYFYNGTSSNAVLLRSIKFEHFPGSNNTTYKTYTFYVEIDLASVTDNVFYVRYSASGWFTDYWKNKNVKIQVGWSTETVKASVGYGLAWGDEAHTYYTITPWPSV